MRLPVCLLLFASLLLLAGGCTTRPLHPVSHRTVLTTSAAPVVFPAEIVAGHFFVVTRWDTNGPWRFLVDTGSSATLVSPEFARHYASGATVPDLPTVHVRSADGDNVLLAGVRLQTLVLGPARFENVTALIYDFAEMSQHFGFKIDGVLGFPLFFDTLLTLDYPHRQLRLTAQSDAPLPGLNLPFTTDHRRPVITTWLAGKPLRTLLDTGANGLLHLNPTETEPSYLVPPRPGNTVSTLTGDRLQEIGRLAAELVVGNKIFVQPVVELTDQLSSLGGEALQHFSLTFDQHRNLIGLATADTAPIVTGAQRSAGISFRKWPAYWRILSLVPGSPADEAGLESGDLVTRINGEPVKMWPLERYDALVKSATAIDFTFLQGRHETTERIAIFELVP